MAKINTQANRKVWKQIKGEHSRDQALLRWGVLLILAAIVTGFLLLVGFTEPPR